MVNYRDYIRDKILKPGEHILEFGPLNGPIVTKERFKHSFYADIRSTEEIKKLYTGNDYLESTGITINTDDIVPIDYVIKGKYADLFKNKKKFDAVVLSHVIEHIPDIIDFFVDVSSIVSHDGKLIIIYPDVRYCFDHFRNGTTFIDALDVYQSGDASRRVFDFAYNVVHENNPALFWGDISQNKLLPNNGFQEALSVCDSAKKGKLPEDMHFWPFADFQFIKFLYDMDRAGYLHFDISEFHPTQENAQEFMVVLTPKKVKEIDQKNYKKQLDRVSPQLLSIRIKDELAEARETNHQLQAINNDLSIKISEADKELKLIYKSKKWRYATKVGIIFNRVKEVFISKKRAR